MDAEGLNRPERGAGLGSVQRGADRDALTPEDLVEELLELLRRVSDREDAGSLFLRRQRAIHAAERDFIGEAVECRS